MQPQMNADQRRLEWTPAASAFIRVHLRFILPAVLLIGCASDKKPSTRPASVSERSDAALRDPFGYSPEMGKADISGGKVNEFDKDGMKRDIDHVLNP